MLIRYFEREFFLIKFCRKAWKKILFFSFLFFLKYYIKNLVVCEVWEEDGEKYIEQDEMELTCFRNLNNLQFDWLMNRNGYFTVERKFSKIGIIPRTSWFNWKVCMYMKYPEYS